MTRKSDLDALWYDDPPGIAEDRIDTLEQRRDYLSFRIEAKTKIGWETTYDRREHDALLWILELVKERLRHGRP